MAMIIVIIL